MSVVHGSKVPSLIPLLLVSGYSSAFYIRVPKTNRAIDPLETTCETEGGSPEFLTNKPSADAFDFYDELKRDGRIPYNPKTFYISANEPWGQNYNVPIIVIENEYRAPLALVTHIFEPKFPAKYAFFHTLNYQKAVFLLLLSYSNI